METGLGESLKSVPHLFELEQNYPNPFNPETMIPFTLAQTRHVILSVYNATGQHVKTLVNTRLSSGTHSVRWHADNLPGGIYLYSMISGSSTETKRMVLLR
jgi:hypothetical protein